MTTIDLLPCIPYADSMNLCACGCGMPVRVGRRFLRWHGQDMRDRERALRVPSDLAPQWDEGPIRNARLLDKPTIRPGRRSLTLRGGTIRTGRLYWFGEYAAKDKAAKEAAYQDARDCAEVMRLRIVEERGE